MVMDGNGMGLTILVVISAIPPTTPSLLVCSTNMNFTFEITLSHSTQIAWSYGRKLPYESLNHPILAKLMSNSKIVISQHADPSNIVSFIQRINDMEYSKESL